MSLTDAADLSATNSCKKRINSVEYSYKPKKVFNFEVADWHTYFVGVLGWLVHNTYLKDLLKVSDDVYDVAKNGGKHGGFLKNYLNKGKDEIEKGIKSLQKQIDEHLDKIKNPEKHLPNFKKLDPRQQDALLNKKWPSDITRQAEQKKILENLLKTK